MSEQQKKSRPQPTRGRDVKKRRSVLIRVAPNTVFRIRNTADLSGLMMLGVVPATLLGAVDRLQKVREAGEKDGAEAAYNSIDSKDRTAFLELLRHVNAAIVIEPRVTLSKRESLADPDVLWLGGTSDVPNDPEPQTPIADVSFDSMFSVYRYLIREGGVVLNEDDADEFRTDSSNASDQRGADGGEVRPETVVVDSGDGTGTVGSGSAPSPETGERRKPKRHNIGETTTRTRDLSPDEVAARINEERPQPTH